MSKTIADLLVETLSDAGVQRIWGVTGDSLNGINDSLRRFKRIEWVPVRHEETAAFAAGASDSATSPGSTRTATPCLPMAVFMAR